MTMVEVQTAQPAPAPADAPSTPTPGRARALLAHALEAYSLVGLLILAAIFFSVWPETADTFPTAANLQTLIGNQAVIAIVALGALIPLVADEWDLSVGAAAGLASVLAATALSGGMAVLPAVLIAVAVGAGVGLANALIVTRLHVHAVIATLGMATLLSGVVNQKTGGTAIVSDIPAGVIDFGSGTWLGIPRTAFALGLVAIGVYYMLDHTPLGRYMYALGASPSAARLVGIRTKMVLGSAFVASGLIAGCGGMLQVARAGGADPNVGEGFTLPALAAAFLSAASIRPGRYNVGGALVAVFFLATLNSGLNLAGAPAYVNSYVNGAALIIGVALATYLGRKRAA